MLQKRSHLFALLLLVIAISCKLPFQTLGKAGFIATAVEQTLQVRRAQVPPAITSVPPSTTGALQPTATLAPQTAENPVPCYEALLIGETVPDGTVYNVGDLFTKSWRLRNTGSCTWNPSYRLVFSGGDQMKATDAIFLNDYVTPGESGDFSVDMEAPGEAGTHTGYWKIKADNGVSFAKVWVQVEVDQPIKKPTAKPTSAPAFTISDIQLAVSQSSDECPVDLTLKVDITANGPGEVELEWDSVDTMGCFPSKSYLTFSAAGTQSIEETCSGLTKDHLKSLLSFMHLKEIIFIMARQNMQWYARRHNTKVITRVKNHLKIFLISTLFLPGYD